MHYAEACELSVFRPNPWTLGKYVAVKFLHISEQQLLSMYMLGLSVTSPLLIVCALLRTGQNQHSPLLLPSSSTLLIPGYTWPQTWGLGRLPSFLNRKLPF